MLAWARNNQVAAFLTIAFAVPWFGWTAREVLPLDGWFQGEVLHRVRWTLFYFGWGVLIAGFTMSYVVGGWAGVKKMLARCFQWRAPWGWWLYIFIAPVLFAGLSRGFAAQSIGVDLGRFEPWNLWVLFTPSLLLVFTIGPLGEEAGWRGFLLPKFLESHSPLTASLLLGVIWMMWHFPLSFTSSSYVEIYQNPNTWLAYMVLVVCFAIQFTIIFLHSRSSLFVAMTFHWMINTRYGVLTKMFPEATSDEWGAIREAPDATMISLAPWIISTIVLIALFRKQLTLKAQ